MFRENKHFFTNIPVVAFKKSIKRLNFELLVGILKNQRNFNVF